MSRIVQCKDKKAHCWKLVYNGYCSSGDYATWMKRNCCKSCKTTKVNCRKSSWSEWSKCSKSCGKGVQERTRTIVKAAQNGGKACSGPNKEKNPCNDRACPGKNFISVNCRWSSWKWGPCSKSCGYGVKYGSRRIVRQARNGGRRCSGSSRQRTSCVRRKCSGSSSSSQGIKRSMLKQLMHFELISILIFLFLRLQKQE